MKMCFHGNQHPWAIKHPFISLYSKYHCLKFICLPVMNSPVFPSLDEIYCISMKVMHCRNHCSICFWQTKWTILILVAYLATITIKPKNTKKTIGFIFELDFERVEFFSKEFVLFRKRTANSVGRKEPKFLIMSIMYFVSESLH